MKKMIISGVTIVALMAGGVAGFAALKPNEFNSLLKFDIKSQEDVYFDAANIPASEKELFKLSGGQFAPLVFNDSESSDEKLKMLDPKTLEYVKPELLKEAVSTLETVRPYKSGIKYFPNDKGMDVCAIYIDPKKELLDEKLVYQQLVAQCKLNSTVDVSSLVVLTADESNKIMSLSGKYKLDRTQEQVLKNTLEAYWEGLYVDIYAIQNYLVESPSASLDEVITKVSKYRLDDAHESFDRQARNSAPALKLLKQLYEAGTVTAQSDPKEVFKEIVSQRDTFLPPIDKHFLMLLYGFESSHDHNFARDWILEDEDVLKYLNPKLN
ncbi:hypothetical protein [Vibrio harveyi]|uniref:hypothetical protein n=1 Tax=Vibrio harveyi TaxID=669 RepID=UPI003CF3C083